MSYSVRFAHFLSILLVLLPTLDQSICAANASFSTYNITASNDDDVDSELSAHLKFNYGQNPEELGPYAEGDIVALPADYSQRSGMIAKKLRWPGAIVPYEIKGTFTPEGQAILNHAFREYQTQTCIRFRPRNAKDRDFISISGDKPGCWSSVGRIGGRQVVNLEPAQCLRTNGTAIHELMHVVGFMHEHNRPERDGYIEVLRQNVKPTMLAAFRKSSPKTVHDFGVAYDYGSVMHYSPRSFSKNGSPTIVALKSNVDSELMGQRKGFSANDIRRINNMYRCKK